MLNRKLLEVLSRLNPVEHKRFRLFIQAPYYNYLRYAEHMLPLYDYIMESRADETAPALDKKEVSRHFFPTREFREKEKGPLDSMTTELFGLVKRFLLERSRERSNQEQQEMFALLRFYSEHGLEERFWQTVGALQKIQEGFQVRDAAFYATQFAIEEEVFYFRSLFNTFEDDANLISAHKSLDTYYSVVKMEYLCALRYQQIVSHMPLGPDSQLTHAIMHMPESDFPEDFPLIKVYKTVFELLKNPGDASKFDLLELQLRENEQVIPVKKYRDLQAYYRIFLNMHYARIGDNTSRQKVFVVYKDHFTKGYFYEEEKITIAALRVLIIFGLKLGQFEWVKKVLDEHPPERICGTRYPAEAHDLNYGEYYFYRKEYEAAKDRVNHRPFENPNLGILADVLLIKVYYETEDELLEYRMKALEQKVRRTGMTAFVKERYFNFLKKLDKVNKYGWQKKNPRRDKLMEEIRTIPEIIEREWLLEKLGVVVSQQ